MERTREKDVIHICKGWYDKDKHDSVIDALRAYQVEVCDTDAKYISYKDILEFSLYPTAEKYFKSVDWKCVIREEMEFDIRMMAAKVFEHIDLSYEYICALLIRAISNLQVKSKDKWIIDMDGYRELKHVV